MRVIALVIFFVSAFTAVAFADSNYLCYATWGSNPELVFAKIPGPGEHSGLNVVHRIPIPDLPYGGSRGMTYADGYWWLGIEGEIYCFDRNGDLVSSFAAAMPGCEVRGMAWDGQYLWYGQSYDIFQTDIYGNPGPYAPFYTSEQVDSLAVVDDIVLVGEYCEYWGSTAYVRGYDFNGNSLFRSTSISSDLYAYIPGLAYHDGVVWVSVNWYEYFGYFLEYHELRGFNYSGGVWGTRYATVEDTCPSSFSVCEADFINIAESSLGKIKAYFATE